MNTIARCNALIDDALAKGARLLTGGRANDTHMSPTLLDGVTREMRLWREESFGPVKAIIRVHSEEEALAVANDSEYGLSAAVYSRDSARAWNVAQRLHTGICHINGPTVHDEATNAVWRLQSLPAMAALAAGPGSRNSPSCAG